MDQEKPMEFLSLNLKEMSQTRGTFITPCDIAHTHRVKCLCKYLKKEKKKKFKVDLHDS